MKCTQRIRKALEKWAGMPEHLADATEEEIDDNFNGIVKEIVDIVNDRLEKDGFAVRIT